MTLSEIAHYSFAKTVQALRLVLSNKTVLALRF